MQAKLFNEADRLRAIYQYFSTKGTGGNKVPLLYRQGGYLEMPKLS